MDETLKLDQLLTTERVVIGLGESSFQDAVLRLLDTLNELVSDREAVENLIKAESATGELSSIGDRALLAHYRTDSVRELGVAIGTSEKPFVFAPNIAPKARILLLVVAPPSTARYYLKVVGSLSRLLRDPENVAAMEQATTPPELLKAARLSGLSIRPELVVQDLMSRDVNAVPPETPLSEVVNVMARHGRRAVPVVSDTGEVLGMITEQELLEHFLPQLKGAGAGTGTPSSLQDVEVRDAMQRSVMCLSEDQLISDVAGIMQNKNVARFPVVREGKLVGFLSRTDIIRKLINIAV